MAEHLKFVQERRNRFLHGDPSAIDEPLHEAMIANLLAVQLGWIAVFNRRCTNKQTLVKVWDDPQKVRS